MPLTGTVYAPGVQVKSQDLNVLVGLATWKSNRCPRIAMATNWAPAGSGSSPLANKGAFVLSSGAGSLLDDLDIPNGYRLSTLTLLCAGNASANLTIGIDQAPNTNAVNVNLGSRTLAALSATPGDQTLTFDNIAATTNAGGQTVTANFAALTFTRSAGSYITDGFLVGQTVTFAGFVNGGNNGARVIASVTATVITVVSNTGMVNETSAANAVTTTAAALPALDGTFALQLKLTASATGLGVAALRYTCVPV